jgi:predicted  nucleic acid-binding Zn-ribbon protein
MAVPPSEPPRPALSPVVGTVATRLWDAIRKLATITEHLRTLEKEDTRTQSQLLELTRNVAELSRDVRDMIGQMRGIEKRLEDKDRLIEATIKLRILEEVEKLRAEFRRDAP